MRTDIKKMMKYNYKSAKFALWFIQGVTLVLITNIVIQGGM